jgi:hypothetical protein
MCNTIQKKKKIDAQLKEGHDIHPGVKAENGHLWPKILATPKDKLSTWFLCSSRV